MHLCKQQHYLNRNLPDIKACSAPGNFGMMSLKPGACRAGSPRFPETAMSGTVLMALAFLRHADLD